MSAETDQVPDELKLSRSEIVLGLREEILSTMKKIEATKSEMKHDMVPRVLSQSIHDLANQDQVKCSSFQNPFSLSYSAFLYAWSIIVSTLKFI